VDFTGITPAILRSTSDVILGANLIGDGKLGGAAGPGGCGGGPAAQSGGCGNRGGAGGASSTTIGEGGGGGGHTENGNPGTGGASGGAMSGNDLVTPLADEAGNGGGGGGNGLVGTGAGGVGGGGGGIITITAGGAIAVEGLVDASGGGGGPGTGACNVNAGGGGGGGSGGAILLRALAVTGAGSLDARGGAGGTRPNCNAGGNGSSGRIRIDVATNALPAITADPAPVRGPHWDDGTPHIVREAELEATLRGAPNRTFAANVDGGEPVDVATNGSGVGTYAVTLEPGHNRICAIVSPTAELSLPEASRCHIVTYVP
jgi:hypothetical protein